MKTGYFLDCWKNESLAREGGAAETFVHRYICGDVLSSRLSLSPTSCCKRNKSERKTTENAPSGQKA